MPSRRPVSPSFDALVGDEYRVVVNGLLGSHPELYAEAEQQARALLETVDVDATASEIAEALENIPLSELACRAGRIPGRGYVHETEAAWELLSEAIDPYRADLRRRAGLGLRDAAAAIAVAIVAGLYRTRASDDGTVIGYAGEDAPGELADEVLNEAERLGITISESAAEEHWPEWAEAW